MLPTTPTTPSERYPPAPDNTGNFLAQPITLNMLQFIAGLVLTAATIVITFMTRINDLEKTILVNNAEQIKRNDVQDERRNSDRTEFVHLQMDVADLRQQVRIKQEKTL
ncbi:hypothetical protein KHS38_12140 [Mucilaginibacter sp. Bleaf8]|uniref:hypothetical protein n=1 Tax=Mucilaginibacter sp. Bleaf8 TaxID=2834430 RepID=UPI001BCEBE83|nr:hypothetical protein [Mucilaginibacter sp. Bleaf8]MBS7565155.1 hypothetical protein [Mucilaginibacter sp. Bleaf8]